MPWRAPFWGLTMFRRLWALVTDVDQLLVFALLAVTVNQLGHYLSQFSPPGWEFVGYLQAIGIDATIWRCAHWYKVYSGSKQRKHALAGLVAFLALSAWFNSAYYMGLTEPAVSKVTAIFMGATLPLSVAAVSYLNGIKETSAFATARPKEKPAPDEEKVKEPAIAGGVLTCELCDRSFAWPAQYTSRRGAQNALNAHTCKPNGRKQGIPPAGITQRDTAKGVLTQ